jgi:hypothetical protein
MDHIRPRRRDPDVARDIDHGVAIELADNAPGLRVLLRFPPVAAAAVA